MLVVHPYVGGTDAADPYSNLVVEYGTVVQPLCTT